MVLQLGLCSSSTVLRNRVCVKRVQAGPVLCNFLLRDLALTRLENYTTFRIYAIIFGLTQFGIDDAWPHLCSVGG